MGSGGKGASSNDVYFGTFMGVIGCGPAYSLEWVIVGGNSLAYSGELLKPSGADYVDVTLIDVGSMRFYFGTETQVADPILSGFAVQPGYRGMVYIICNNCVIGSAGSTVPTIQICWRRYPNQTIVTNINGSAINDTAFSANPIVVAAELISSWDWLGAPSSLINAATFQAAADSFQSEIPSGDVRPWAAISPMWNEQTDLKSALADVCSVSQAWFRDGTTGLIEAGRWFRSNSSITNVSALTFDDLIDLPEFEASDSDKLPNSFVVTYTDSTLHHKENCLTCDNTAAQRAIGITRRQTASRPLLLLAAQAKRHGGDLIQQNAQPTLTFTGKVRRARAVKPDGTYIRPGDYFTFPVNDPGQTADVRLFRCMKRSFDPYGPVTLEGDLEINTGIQATTAFPAANLIPPATPPVYYYRMLSMAPAQDGFPPPVGVFCARPSDMSYNVAVGYSNSISGDYGDIGTANFALPMSLNAAVAATDTSIKLTLLPQTAGLNPQRDVELLTDWTGGSTEADADELVLVLVKKSAGAVVLNGSGLPWVEFMSVAGPATVVSGSTYSVPVLRGRRSTAAQAFNTGAFPDAWTDYEAWIIPLANLTPITHPDFAGLIAVGGTGYFTLTDFAQMGNYTPTEAFAEYNRRVAASIPLGEFVNQTSGSIFQGAFSFTFDTDALVPVYSPISTAISLLQLTNYVYQAVGAAPATPVGGSFTSPVPTTAGWSTAIPVGATVWMTKRMFTYNGIGQDATWSVPTVAFGINPVAPGAAAACSLNTEAVYVAPDGTIRSQITLNIPALPSNAQRLEIQYRITGTASWLTAGAVAVGGVTMTISNLAPGTSYDVQSVGISYNVVTGAATAATGSPFIAPVKTVLPSTPTGLSMRAALPSDGIAGSFDTSGIGGPGSSQLLPCGILTYTPPTDPDIVAVQFCTSTSSGPTLPAGIGNSGSPITSAGYTQTIYGKQPPFLAIFNGSFGIIPVNTVYLRFFDSSGNASAWASVGFATGTAYAGDLASQNAAATQLQSMIIAPVSASSPTANTVRFRFSIIVTTTAALSNVFYVSLSGSGFTAKPAGGTVTAAGWGDMMCQYNFYDSGNSSAQAAIYVQMPTGNVPAGRGVNFIGELWS
jgi:hypothetical protein